MYSEIDVVRSMTIVLRQRVIKFDPNHCCSTRILLFSTRLYSSIRLFLFRSSFLWFSSLILENIFKQIKIGCNHFFNDIFLKNRSQRSDAYVVRNLSITKTNRNRSGNANSAANTKLSSFFNCRAKTTTNVGSETQLEPSQW